MEWGEHYSVKEVLSHSQGAFIRYNYLPSPDQSIQVFEGKKAPSSVARREAHVSPVKLYAFPNPFNHETRIELSATSGISGKLVLMDMQGRRIREIQLTRTESYTLFRDELPPGMYILQLIEYQGPVLPLKLIIRE